MKNTLILMLVFSIVLSGILPLKAYGQTVDEKLLEDVVLKFKGLLQISDDYDNFTSRVNSYDDEVSFYLGWSDSKEQLPSINIQADSKGNIISFNRYSNNPIESETRLSRISKDEALNMARDFIEKIAPDVFKELELKESLQAISTWDRNYSFSFIRNINDIPYNSNTVNISIDMESGEVSDLYINWERNLKFPSVNNIISLDEAKEVYEEEIGLKLVYKQKGRSILRDNGQVDNNYYLAYTNLGNPKAIDAKTGKSINLSYYSMYSGAEKATTEDSMSDGGQMPIITPEEREEIDKLKGLKSIEEVEKEARDILDLDNSYKLRSKNLNSSWNNPDEFYYSLGFIKTIDEKEYSTDISINAKTLELINFNKYRSFNSEAKATIDKKEALELAKGFIGKINPDKIDQIELLENNFSNDNDQYYGFSFIRKVDGIYVESDHISIGVDAVNKDIYSYNINWYKGDFPSKDKIISIDKAYELLFQKIGLNLNYTNIYKVENISKGQESEIKLVYSISQDKPSIIDASTGDILDYSGDPYKENKIIEYRDIDNSYARDKIITLAEYGVGFSSDKFNPRDTISQEDFAYLLWRSMNPYGGLLEQDMDEIYKGLIRQRIIKAEEENRERALTKEEAVKFIIRAMNYEKLAEIPNIYANIFNDDEDIDPNLKGHMTLAYGLKIINGGGSESVKPKYEIKREDAASIIYNYMFLN